MGLPRLGQAETMLVIARRDTMYLPIGYGESPYRGCLHRRAGHHAGDELHQLVERLPAWTGAGRTCRSDEGEWKEHPPLRGYRDHPDRPGNGEAPAVAAAGAVSLPLRLGLSRVLDQNIAQPPRL